MSLSLSVASHFWVVAVRLGSEDPGFLQSSPSAHFTSSQSLTTYSDGKLLLYWQWLQHTYGTCISSKTEKFCRFSSLFD